MSYKEEDILPIEAEQRAKLKWGCYNAKQLKRGNDGSPKKATSPAHMHQLMRTCILRNFTFYVLDVLSLHVDVCLFNDEVQPSDSLPALERAVQ